MQQGCGQLGRAGLLAILRSAAGLSSGRALNTWQREIYLFPGPQGKGRP